jgi:hypothetical protein
MAKNEQPKQSRLRELFDYEDGILIWKKELLLSRRKKGRVAGCVSNYGYVVIRVDLKLHPRARLVYIWHKGEIPEGKVIDHINHVRTDDRIENLQPLTLIENIKKRPAFNR